MTQLRTRRATQPASTSGATTECSKKERRPRKAPHATDAPIFHKINWKFYLPKVEERRREGRKGREKEGERGRERGREAGVREDGRGEREATCEGCGGWET